MSIRSFLHRTIDKSANAIDKARNGSRKAAKALAEKTAERLAKDPADLKISKLQAELEAAKAAKSEKVTSKKKNPQPSQPQQNTTSQQ